jgi:hypothetical protein
MPVKSLLPATWQLPDPIKARLGQRVGRQRAMVDGGHLLLVLHQPPQQDEDERQGRLFWRQPDGTWSSSHHGGGIGSVGKLLSEYDGLVEQYDRQLEKAHAAQGLLEVLEGLSPLQRAIRNMHAALQHARQALPDVRDIIDLRDRAYEIERRAELLYNDARNALEFVQAQEAEQQSLANQRMAVSAHRLNLLVAFFFPLATLAAILGINVRHGLEDAPAPWTFLLVLSVGLFLGIFLQAFIGARPRGDS